MLERIEKFPFPNPKESGNKSYTPISWIPTLQGQGKVSVFKYIYKHFTKQLFGLKTCQVTTASPLRNLKGQTTEYYFEFISESAGYNQGLIKIQKTKANVSSSTEQISAQASSRTIYI